MAEEKCVGCGIPLGREMPEDAAPEEMRCDSCNSIYANELPPLQELFRTDLDREDAMYFLGLMAAHSLKTFGQVNMMIAANDRVCIANPIHVYFDAGAYVHEDLAELPPFQWKRPIVSEGRPQYVAWREGELWEIEFDEEPEAKSG